MWADPPWEREGRRPSLDELIPGSDVEVTRHGDAVRDAVVGQLDGRSFAGLELRVDRASVDVFSGQFSDTVQVRIGIVDPARPGSEVGYAVRTFTREADGTLVVRHDFLQLGDAYRGNGFAQQFNRSMESWYRESGVSHIEVHAAMETGGYAWARAGYDWMPGTEHRVRGIMQRLRNEMGAIRADIGRIESGLSPDELAAVQARYGVDTPQELLPRLRDELAAGEQIQRDAGRYGWDNSVNPPRPNPGYPTPYEISRAGSGGRSGRDATWIGKRVLLGSNWYGVKPISDTGPLHPRPGSGTIQ
jgi:hypothetical protein